MPVTVPQQTARLAPQAPLIRNGKHGLRLAPIEKPKGLKLRFLYWATRKQFGVTPMALKVVAPRLPGLLKLSMAFQGFERKLRLPKELRLLVTALVSGHNGCGFCLDLKHMLAVKEGLSLTKFNALAQFETSNLFSAREKAAFRYALDVTINRKPSDATFQELERHFADWEVVELTYINAMENFANLCNIPLGIESEGLCALVQARKK